MGNITVQKDLANVYFRAGTTDEVSPVACRLFVVSSTAKRLSLAQQTRSLRLQSTAAQEFDVTRFFLLGGPRALPRLDTNGD